MCIRDSPGMDILSVIYKHGVPNEFPKEVEEQTKEMCIRDRS